MKTSTTARPLKLTQTTEGNGSETALQNVLSEFVRWVLRITASGECSGDLAIALLDRAWTAQKLLWKLRQ